MHYNRGGVGLRADPPLGRPVPILCTYSPSHALHLLLHTCHSLHWLPMGSRATFTYTKSQDPWEFPYPQGLQAKEWPLGGINSTVYLTPLQSSLQDQGAEAGASPKITTPPFGFSPSPILLFPLPSPAPLSIEPYDLV